MISLRDAEPEIGEVVIISDSHDPYHSHNTLGRYIGNGDFEFVEGMPVIRCTYICWRKWGG